MPRTSDPASNDSGIFSLTDSEAGYDSLPTDVSETLYKELRERKDEIRCLRAELFLSSQHSLDKLAQAEAQIAEVLGDKQELQRETSVLEKDYYELCETVDEIKTTNDRLSWRNDELENENMRLAEEIKRLIAELEQLAAENRTYTLPDQPMVMDPKRPRQDPRLNLTASIRTGFSKPEDSKFDHCLCCSSRMAGGHRVRSKIRLAEYLDENSNIAQRLIHQRGMMTEADTLHGMAGDAGILLEMVRDVKPKTFWQVFRQVLNKSPDTKDQILGNDLVDFTLQFAPSAFGTKWKLDWDYEYTNDPSHPLPRLYKQWSLDGPSVFPVYTIRQCSDYQIREWYDAVSGGHAEISTPNDRRVMLKFLEDLQTDQWDPDSPFWSKRGLEYLMYGWSMFGPDEVYRKFVLLALRAVAGRMYHKLLRSGHAHIRSESISTAPLLDFSPVYVNYQWEIPAFLRQHQEQCPKAKPRGRADPEAIKDILARTAVSTGCPLYGFELDSFERCLASRTSPRVGKLTLDALSAAASLFYGSTLLTEDDTFRDFEILTTSEHRFLFSVGLRMSPEERAKLVETIAWACAALRPRPRSWDLDDDPQLQGDGLISRSSPRQWRPIISDDLHLTLYDLSPLERVPSGSLGSNVCWAAMFGHLIIAWDETPRPKRAPWPYPGMKMPLSLMKQVSCAETPYIATKASGEEGIILVGSITAMVPMKRAGHAIQWHYAYTTFRPSEHGGITIANPTFPYGIPCIDSGQWYSTLDSSELVNCDCWVGMHSEANVLLGTERLRGHLPRLSYSRFKPLTHTWKLRGFTPQAQVQLGGGSVPLNASASLGGNFVWVGTTVRSTASKNYLKSLLDDKRQVAIVYDDATDLAWLVPLSSLVLHLCQKYICDALGFGKLDDWGGFPVPFAKPSADGAAAAYEVLLQGGEKVVLSSATGGSGGGGGAAINNAGDSLGHDQLRLRQVYDAVRTALRESTMLKETETTTRLSARNIGKLAAYTTEAVEAINASDHGSCLRKIVFDGPLRGAAHWRPLMETAHAFCSCRDLGPAIEPVVGAHDTSHSEVPGGNALLVAHLSCLHVLAVPHSGGFGLGRIEDGVCNLGRGAYWCVDAPPWKNQNGNQIQIQARDHTTTDGSLKPFDTMLLQRVVSRVKNKLTKNNRESSGPVPPLELTTRGVVVFGEISDARSERRASASSSSLSSQHVLNTPTLMATGKRPSPTAAGSTGGSTKTSCRSSESNPPSEVFDLQGPDGQPSAESDYEEDTVADGLAVKGLGGCRDGNSTAIVPVARLVDEQCLSTLVLAKQDGETGLPVSSYGDGVVGEVGVAMRPKETQNTATKRGINNDDDVSNDNTEEIKEKRQISKKQTTLDVNMSSNEKQAQPLAWSVRHFICIYSLALLALYVSPGTVCLLIVCVMLATTRQKVTERTVNPETTSPGIFQGASKELSRSFQGASK